MYGGGQQRGMRSGTINVPGIAGLGQAAKEAYENLEKNREYISGIKDMIIDGAQKLDGVTVSSLKGDAGAMHVVSILPLASKTCAVPGFSTLLKTSINAVPLLFIITLWVPLAGVSRVISPLCRFTL